MYLIIHVLVQSQTPLPVPSNLETCKPCSPDSCFAPSACQCWDGQDDYIPQFVSSSQQQGYQNPNNIYGSDNPQVCRVQNYPTFGTQSQGVVQNQFWYSMKVTGYQPIPLIHQAPFNFNPLYDDGNNFGKMQMDFYLCISGITEEGSPCGRTSNNQNQDFGSYPDPIAFEAFFGSVTNQAYLYIAPISGQFSVGVWPYTNFTLIYQYNTVYYNTQPYCPAVMSCVSVREAGWGNFGWPQNGLCGQPINYGNKIKTYPTGWRVGPNSANKLLYNILPTQPTGGNPLLYASQFQTQLKNMFFNFWFTDNNNYVSTPSWLAAESSGESSVPVFYSTMTMTDNGPAVTTSNPYWGSDTNIKYYPATDNAVFTQSTSGENLCRFGGGTQYLSSGYLSAQQCRYNERNPTDGKAPCNTICPYTSANLTANGGTVQTTTDLENLMLIHNRAVTLQMQPSNLNSSLTCRKDATSTDFGAYYEINETNMNDMKPLVYWNQVLNIEPGMSASLLNTISNQNCQTNTYTQSDSSLVSRAFTNGLTITNTKSMSATVREGATISPVGATETFSMSQSRATQSSQQDLTSYTQLMSWAQSEETCTTQTESTGEQFTGTGTYWQFCYSLSPLPNLCDPIHKCASIGLFNNDKQTFVKTNGNMPYCLPQYLTYTNGFVTGCRDGALNLTATSESGNFTYVNNAGDHTIGQAADSGDPVVVPVAPRYRPSEKTTKADTESQAKTVVIVASVVAGVVGVATLYFFGRYIYNKKIRITINDIFM